MLKNEAAHTIKWPSVERWRSRPGEELDVHGLMGCDLKGVLLQDFIQHVLLEAQTLGDLKLKSEAAPFIAAVGKLR